MLIRGIRRWPRSSFEPSGRRILFQLSGRQRTVWDNGAARVLDNPETERHCRGDMIALSDTEFHLFRGYIEQSCGIALGNEKAYLVQNRLVGLLNQTGSSSYTDLYRKAVDDKTLGLRDKIINAMTTNETLWFRDGYPFQILSEVILDRLFDAVKRGKRQKIRIWSAACSTGQEPYSIAMTIHEYARKHAPGAADLVEILATDISQSVLFLSAAARYDTISISRGLSTEMRDRYFEFNGKIWMLKDKVKGMVKFKRFNLQESFSLLGDFDVVFLRYAIIYFSDNLKCDIFSKTAKLLAPGGYLFLGGSETVGGYSTDFATHRHGSSIYYQAK